MSAFNVPAAHSAERSLQQGTSRLAASRSSPPWTPGVTDPSLYTYEQSFDDRESNPLRSASTPPPRPHRTSPFGGMATDADSPGEQGDHTTGEVEHRSAASRGGADWTSSNEEEPDDKGYDTPEQERLENWRAFFEDPESSSGAGMLSLLILGLICVSTVALVVETVPTFDNTEDKRSFFILESCCIGLFTLEYSTRLILAEVKCEFVQHGMNLIDLISIIPFWVDLLIWATTGTAPYEASGGASDLTRVLRLFRLVRVFRVFKLGRNSKSLLIAFKSVMASLDTLGLMIFILFIMLVLFGAFVYNFEIGEWKETCSVAGVTGGCYEVEDDLGVKSVSLYISIPEAMWWCVVTVMTVGYGEIYPLTPGGKFFASICMVSSIVILALPISVIGINFSAMWSAEENSARMKSDCMRLQECGEEADNTLGTFLASVNFYLHQLRTVHKSVRERSEALIADLSAMASTQEGVSVATGDTAAGEPSSDGIEMKPDQEPDTVVAGEDVKGMLHHASVSTVHKDHAASQLFALKVDEVCMQAIYERVMCFFPLQRVRVGEPFEPREQAAVGVQRQLRRTKYNGNVVLRLADEVDKVEKELFAMKKFVNFELPPEEAAATGSDSNS